MQHTFDTALELEIKVIASVTPATPPRPSSDPDSPAYSDPGDPGEKFIEAVLVINRQTGKHVDITDCMSAEQLDELADQAYEDVAAADGE